MASSVAGNFGGQHRKPPPGPVTSASDRCNRLFDPGKTLWQDIVLLVDGLSYNFILTSLQQTVQKTAWCKSVLILDIIAIDLMTGFMENSVGESCGQLEAKGIGRCLIKPGSNAMSKRVANISHRRYSLPMKLNGVIDRLRKWVFAVGSGTCESRRMEICVCVIYSSYGAQISVGGAQRQLQLATREGLAGNGGVRLFVEAQIEIDLVTGILHRQNPARTDQAPRLVSAWAGRPRRQGLPIGFSGCRKPRPVLSFSQIEASTPPGLQRYSIHSTLAHLGVGSGVALDRE